MKILIFLFFVKLELFSEIEKGSFLMGSVVKSDLWEIDRTKNIEIFRGNVFFENNTYFFRSDTAIYNHTSKEWDAYGEVYCRKKIDEKRYLELSLDEAKYFEQSQILSAKSTKRRKITLRYLEIPDINWRAFSKRADVYVNLKEVYFIGDFELYISSISAFAEKAVYKEENATFQMQQKPKIKTFTDRYNLYLKAKDIMVNRKEYTITASSDVYGAVYRRDYETLSKESE